MTPVERDFATSEDLAPLGVAGDVKPIRCRECGRLLDDDELLRFGDWCFDCAAGSGRRLGAKVDKRHRRRAQ